MSPQPPIQERDLEAAERLLAATLAHCHQLQDQQRHGEAARSAAGAVRLMGTMRATEAVHGFFADLVLQPFADAFHGFLPPA